jgi:transposase
MELHDYILWEATDMEVVYNKCCGIDVHKNKLVACLRMRRKEEIREFTGKTKDIREMARWLKESDCEMIAMESTSVYWKPLVNIFEIHELPFMVVNAKDFKNVPGRKTDILDSQWLCQLLKHGLLKSSFIPSREQRELREACRYRKKLVEERARALNRLQKQLEGANIKLSSIVSNIDGVTSMNLLDYVLNNEDQVDAVKAKELIITRIGASTVEVVEAMDGVITPFQKVMMKEVILHLNELATRISSMDEMIDKFMPDYYESIKKLEQMPGIGKRTAEIVLAEIGLDMSRFPTSSHLASWAGLSPGNNESAGKRKSGRTRKGNTILKSTLAQAAKAAVKNKNSFYYAQYQRVSVRRGKNRATIAVAHSMLISIYHMLQDGIDFVDLGADFYTQFNTEKKANSYIRKLEQLGYTIEANKSVS